MKEGRQERDRKPDRKGGEILGVLAGCWMLGAEPELVTVLLEFKLGF